MQIACCLNLDRDRRGNLIRRGDRLPPGVEVDEDGMRVVSNPCGLGAAVVKARVAKGMDPEKARQSYREWWTREFHHSSYAH